MTANEQYFRTNTQKKLSFHQQKTKSFDGYRRVVTTDDVKVI